MVNNRTITVLGAGGWIGSALVSYLRAHKYQVNAVHRDSLSSWLSRNDYTPVVIFAIGLTSDFRGRPFQTVEAHVEILSKVIRRPGIESLLLLSSTRVYSKSTDTCESALLPCTSVDPSDLYNLSKLLGESLVLQDPRPGFKVVRVSNVFGPSQPSDTFLGAIISEASSTGSVSIQQPPQTQKDYILLSDVVRLLPLIAFHGSHRLYNLASGCNTTHAQIANALTYHGFHVDFSRCSHTGPTSEPININRLISEFGHPDYILGDKGMKIFSGELLSG